MKLSSLSNHACIRENCFAPRVHVSRRVQRFAFAILLGTRSGRGVLWGKNWLDFRGKSTRPLSLFRLFDYDQVARLFFRQRIAGESRPRLDDARSRVVTRRSFELARSRYCLSKKTR